MRRLRNGGQLARYDHKIKGLNSRLDEMQAAILRVKLPYLDGDNDIRRTLAARYTAALAGLGKIENGATHKGEDAILVPVERLYARHIYHLYVIRMRDRARRDGLLTYLNERGVGAQIHYPIPAHRQPAYADLNLPPGSLPRVENLAGRIATLPLYPEMAPDAVDYVAQQVTNYVTVQS